MNKIILSLLLILFSISVFSQTVVGDWYGLLDIGESEVTVVFHISETEEGYSTTFDSPDQGIKGLPTDKTIVSDNTIKIIAEKLKVNFKGKYDKEKDYISGELSQGKNTSSIKMTREPMGKEVKRRAQEPTEFPYVSEEVRIKNKEAEVVLSGTLTLPEVEELKRVVVLISGSGPQDRNSELGPFNHRPFLVWSDYLTRNGIAVLRYDDRGVARSTGDFKTATSADFANDAEAIVEYLESREDMEGVEIGLMGHSEGGMIAPMVAARNKNVDFVVLLAAPGVPNSELLLKQKYDFAKASFLPQEMIDYDQECGKRVFSFIKENSELNEDEFYDGLYKIVLGNVSDYNPILKGGKTDEDVAKAEMAAYSSPWFRYFIAYDPFKNLASMVCPVFAINGTLDLQVNNDQNLEKIEIAMKKGRNENYKIKSYEDLNHLLQKAETGNVTEYGTIEETVNEEVMYDVAEWINRL